MQQKQNTHKNENENKNPRHNTLTKTRQANEMAWITIDMTFHRKEDRARECKIK